MKTKLFEPNILPISLLFGILGGILMILIVFLNPKFISLSVLPPIFPWILQRLIRIAPYFLAMFIAIIIYKRKENSNLNYFKAFIIAFLVYGVITFMGTTYIKAVRFFQEGYVFPLSHSIINFFRLAGIGIASSLIVALFSIYFCKKNEKVPLS